MFYARDYEDTHAKMQERHFSYVGAFPGAVEVRSRFRRIAGDDRTYEWSSEVDVGDLPDTLEPETFPPDEALYPPQS